MKYWIMKSEPDAYGIDDLKRDKVEHWDGIRNYQVRNMMRDQMQKGDLAFFYHSNCNPPGIAGSMEIVKTAYPDFTAFDPDSKYFDAKSNPDNPRWLMVDVKFKKKFKNYVSLETLKQTKALEDMLILRKGNRLSITEISAKHWKAILKLAGEG